jgi:hypothetical protein
MLLCKNRSNLPFNPTARETTRDGQADCREALPCRASAI